MKKLRSIPAIGRLAVLAALFSTSVIFTACNNDKSHSATDGGSMRMMKTDTLSEAADTTHNVQP